MGRPIRKKMQNALYTDDFGVAYPILYYNNKTRYLKKQGERKNSAFGKHELYMCGVGIMSRG